MWNRQLPESQLRDSVIGRAQLLAWYSIHLNQASRARRSSTIDRATDHAIGISLRGHKYEYKERVVGLELYF
jgi:hypothetical protein